MFIPCLLISWSNNWIRFCFGRGGLLFCYLGFSVIKPISELNPSSSPSDIVRGTRLTTRKRVLLAMLMVESGIQDYFGSYICTNSKPILQFPLTDEAALELIATKPLFNKSQTRVYLHPLFYFKE